MTAEDARTSPSLALARRILAVGLFAGVLALLLVNDRGTSQSVTTTVSFDTPAPPGGPGPFDGVFGGIDFGAVSWGFAKTEALQEASPTVMFERVSDIARLI